ncbi:MAG: hypothetical protein HP491_07065 [Nitrospira sp.]|nr:hypothetical protein [Nitrospira sp.]MBH0184413.1 hypothetical protein [Nitrospira sp.]
MSALHNDNDPAAARLKLFFHPRHVAVVGASLTPNPFDALPTLNGRPAESVCTYTQA